MIHVHTNTICEIHVELDQRVDGGYALMNRYPIKKNVHA